MSFISNSTPLLRQLNFLVWMQYKIQCLKVFCYHGNKSTILPFYSIFRATAKVSSKLYFVEICQVPEKLWIFIHKRADFLLPNFGFKRSLLSLLKLFPYSIRDDSAGLNNARQRDLVKVKGRTSIFIENLTRVLLRLGKLQNPRFLQTVFS